MADVGRETTDRTPDKGIGQFSLAYILGGEPMESPKAAPPQKDTQIAASLQAGMNTNIYAGNQAGNMSWAGSSASTKAWDNIEQGLNNGRGLAGVDRQAA
jgi:hypothetical protein